MRIVTCRVDGLEKLGFLVDDVIYLNERIDNTLPLDMMNLLQGGEQALQAMQQAEKLVAKGQLDVSKGIGLANVQLLAPVPSPSSLRDAYAFRQHVYTSRRNRGLEMIPEFDEFPVFYFSNHRSVVGPGTVSCETLHFEQLDFELEVAVVLNKGGKNIKASTADDYIAGYMIMNDLSARKMQMDEMKLNLGPAKGKDFATAMGPWLVTKDDLEAYKVATADGHIGDTYNLKMTCKVNDVELSAGNLADMHWTFAEIIERASYGVELYPGDVIGSGTVGTGCLLELNSTGRFKDPTYQEKWLKPGDQVKMEVTALGILSNTVELTSKE